MMRSWATCSSTCLLVRYLEPSSSLTRCSRELGYETTANAIAYGLIVLALHQNIQTEVINEVDAVYARAQQAGRTKLTYGDDFEALEYTYGFMVREAGHHLQTSPHSRNPRH